MSNRSDRKSGSWHNRQTNAAIANLSKTIPKSDLIMIKKTAIQQDKPSDMTSNPQVQTKPKPISIQPVTIAMPSVQQPKIDPQLIKESKENDIKQEKLKKNDKHDEKSKTPIRQPSLLQSPLTLNRQSNHKNIDLSSLSSYSSSNDSFEINDGTEHDQRKTSSLDHSNISGDDLSHSESKMAKKSVKSASTKSFRLVRRKPRVLTKSKPKISSKSTREPQRGGFVPKDSESKKTIHSKMIRDILTPLNVKSKIDQQNKSESPKIKKDNKTNRHHTTSSTRDDQEDFESTSTSNRQDASSDGNDQSSVYDSESTRQNDVDDKHLPYRLVHLKQELEMLTNDTLSLSQYLQCISEQVNETYLEHEVIALKQILWNMSVHVENLLNNYENEYNEWWREHYEFASLDQIIEQREQHREPYRHLFERYPEISLVLHEQDELLQAQRNKYNQKE